ncbi:TonB-dependent receptor [Solimicrobium silvestre]|uniref:TonB-Xanth-Caul: TonB-dependent receptor n=1 Tax=Solimicrobium silvestre TaxID=2099400 RepID=A0A2S9H5A8_9BURK|nr:TonB-dependent receptor [Solimicrobium silvestre]PRC95113.1 TonB-Xanth-Caul: TonB-dependent receptor [Solimicrobium silvestre]
MKPIDMQRIQPVSFKLTPLAKSILLLCSALCANTALVQPAWAAADETPLVAEASPADAGDTKPVSAIEEITILGQRATAYNAIKAQKEAPNLINVLTSDEIRKLPDVNVAEAVARLPGISLETDTGEGRFINIRGLDSDLNSTTFAGLRLPPSNPASPQNGGRAVALDAIPNGLVGSITVTKSNLPEQDAEALGGTIEITPKTAPADGKPFFDGHIGSGYEGLRGTAITDVSATVGGRFGGSGEHTNGISSYSDHPFSAVFTAAYYHDKRGIDDVEQSYIDDGVHPSNSLADIDMRRYQYDRQRHGVGLDLGAQPDANSTYYIRAFDAGYTEAKQNNHLQITMDGNPVTAPGGGFTDGVSANGFDKFLTDEKEKIDNQVFMVGGQNKFGGNVLDYRLGYTKGSYNQFYDYKADFNYTPSAGSITYNNTGAGNTSLFNVSGANYLNPGNYTLGSFKNQTEDITDHEWSFASNLKMPVSWGSFDDENIKFGLDARVRTRNAEEQPYSYKGIPNLPLTSVATGGDTTFYNGIYQIGPLIPAGELNTQLASYQIIKASDMLNAQLAYQHDTENVNSLYWQYQMTAGKLGVIAGVRVENTNAQYDAISQGVDAGGNNVVEPSSMARHYTNAFPSAQARYELDPATLLRASFSSTIARPGFNQINPSVQVSSADNTVSVGNPNLKPTTANSFDLSYEKYLPHSGIFSVGLFDKEIKNYIVATTYNQMFQNSGLYAGLAGEASVTSFTNTNSGYARGLEFNYQQKFKELPDFWSGFGVNLNYTFVDSGTDIHPGFTSMLPSTSRNNANAMLFYERDGLDLRLGVNYVSADLWAIGGNATTPDTFSDARLQVDFGGSYVINEKISLYFSAKNISNTPLKFYEGSPDRPIQREFYGPTFLAGLNFSY